MRPKSVARLKRRINREYYFAFRENEMEKEALQWLYEYSIMNDTYCLDRYKQFVRKAEWYAKKDAISETFIHKVDKESAKEEKVAETARKCPKTEDTKEFSGKIYRHYAFVPVEQTPEEFLRDTLAKILATRIKRYFKPQKRMVDGKECWAYDFKIVWNDRTEITK